MARRVMLWLVAAALVLPAAAGAQGKPDFSGTWVVSSKSPEDFNGSNQYGTPSQMVIKQSATEVVVESDMWAVGPMKIVYKLDGSDTIWDNMGMGQTGRKMTVKWRSKAKLEGGTLTLYTWDMSLNQMKDIMTLSGSTLNVVRTIEQPGPSVQGKLTFTKK